jgi:hypothetical protein
MSGNHPIMHVDLDAEVLAAEFGVHLLKIRYDTGKEFVLIEVVSDGHFGFAANLSGGTFVGIGLGDDPLPLATIFHQFPEGLFLFADQD